MIQVAAEAGACALATAGSPSKRWLLRGHGCMAVYSSRDTCLTDGVAMHGGASVVVNSLTSPGALQSRSGCHVRRLCTAPCPCHQQELASPFLDLIYVLSAIWRAALISAVVHGIKLRETCCDADAAQRGDMVTQPCRVLADRTSCACRPACSLAVGLARWWPLRGAGQERRLERFEGGAGATGHRVRPAGHRLPARRRVARQPASDRTAGAAGSV